MDEEENQRWSGNPRFSNRRSSVVSLERNSGMSRQRSLNQKRSMIEVMNIDAMDQQSIQCGLFEQIAMSNNRHSFFRSSNNSQNSHHENSMEAEESRNSNNYNRRSSNSNRVIFHDCVCQGSCSEICPCFLAPNQLCLQGYCCQNCIEAKYRSIYDVVPSTGCICKNSKCLKSYCKCFQNGNKCDPNICRCQRCENISTTQTIKQKKRQKNNKKAQNQTQEKKNQPLNKNKQKNQQYKGESCSCKKSHCLKKYCYCYSIGKQCNQFCECIQCHNKYDEEDDIQQKQYQRQRFGRVDSENQMDENEDIDKYLYQKNYEDEQMPMSMEFDHPDMSRSYQH